MAKLSLLLVAGCYFCDAVRLKRKHVAFPEAEPLDPFGHEARGLTQPAFQLINRTDIEVKSTGKCICPLGQFWHWKEGGCKLQGANGSSCDGFPTAHLASVCQDGLTCKGIGSKAVCTACSEEETCYEGTPRHQATCLKEHSLQGQACITVSVLLPPVNVTKGATGQVEVIQHRRYVVGKGEAESAAEAVSTKRATVTKNVKRSATATAQEMAEASATATDSAKATSTKTETGEYTAKAESSATASGEAYGYKSNVSVSAAAEATRSGVASASAEAEAKVEKTESSKAYAQTQSKADASAEAEASATRSASVRKVVKKTVEVKLKYGERRTKTVKAAVTGVGSAQGSSVQTSCVGVEEAMKLVFSQRSDSNKGDAVKASEVSSAGILKAFERAAQSAVAAATSGGMVLANEIAQRLAVEKVKEEIKLKAKAAKDELEAWQSEAISKEEVEKLKANAQVAAEKKAESLAAREAQAQAIEGADKMAFERAKEAANKEATELANAEAAAAAEEKAALEASEQAKKMAQEAAEKAAKAKAADSASESAKAAAQAEADRQASENAKAKARQSVRGAAEEEAEKNAKAAAEAKAQAQADKAAAETARTVADLSKPGGALGGSAVEAAQAGPTSAPLLRKSA
eukprot:TRINITY_DN19522_c0_g2_i1.p1 TRINITY_DN19522_c0_g2~~TRINITY_DN19522_c0_g2_i1.p1  ORF type:complete len:648 (-),score=206.22 TRINITY_DN19522_c0_g2_i1:58-1962(-)